MEIVKRANLKNKNDILGMLLELATVQALKNIPLYVERHSQFNEFYQQDRSKGPDIIFEFGDKKTGVIECKNVNNDFKVSKDWFKDSVVDRFFPMFGRLDAYFVVISQFKTSPPKLASELRERYHILSVGFQITDQASYEAAIPIIQNKLTITTEWIKKYPTDSKKGS